MLMCCSVAIYRRSSIIVRNNVRRDDDGFEDIDEFWAQDADDDTIDEEDDECAYGFAFVVHCRKL